MIQSTNDTVYDMTHADEVIRECGGVPTLQARMGTGGNQVPIILEPIVLESNQNHTTITQTGIVPTLPAAAGLGGGLIPMVVVEPTTYDGSQITSPYHKESEVGGASDE